MERLGSGSPDERVKMGLALTPEQEAERQSKIADGYRALIADSFTPRFATPDFQLTERELTIARERVDLLMIQNWNWSWRQRAVMIGRYSLDGNPQGSWTEIGRRIVYSDTGARQMWWRLLRDFRSQRAGLSEIVSVARERQTPSLTDSEQPQTF